MVNRIGDPRSDFPRLTRALARYSFCGPSGYATADDIADAAETLGDYTLWRAAFERESMPACDHPTFYLMRDVIRAAFTHRHTRS